MTYIVQYAILDPNKDTNLKNIKTMKKLFFLLAAFTTVLAAQAQSNLVGISPTKSEPIPQDEAIAYLFNEQVGPTIKRASYLEEWDVVMHTAQGRGLLLGQMNKVNEQSNFALTGGKEIEITAEMAKEIWLKYFHHVLLVDANGDPVSLNLYGIVGEGQDPEAFNRMAHDGEGAWAFLVKTSEGKSAYILSLSDFCLNTFAFKIPDLSGVTFVKSNEKQKEEPVLSDDDSEDVDEKGGDSETDVTVETDGKTIIIKNNITVHGATATITNSGNSTNTGGNSTVAPSGQGNNTAPTLWDAQVPVQPFTVQQQPQSQGQPQAQNSGGQCNHGMNNCSCSNYVASGQTQVVRTYPPGTGLANVVGAIGTLATGAGVIMLGTAALNGQFQDQNSFTFNGTGTTTNPGFTPVGIETNGSGTFGANGIGTTWP